MATLFKPTISIGIAFVIVVLLLSLAPYVPCKYAGGNVMMPGIAGYPPMSLQFQAASWRVCTPALWPSLAMSSMRLVDAPEPFAYASESPIALVVVYAIHLVLSYILACVLVAFIASIWRKKSSI